MINKQLIKEDEFIDDSGKIRKTIGPLGKPMSFGYYTICPRCGGKIVEINSYNQGYGSQSSSHVRLQCTNCGWKTHVVYD